jgi:hypothetical protein
MTGDIFVSRQENFAAVPAFFRLIESGCESQWIGRFSGTELSEGRRDQLDAGVRESNASIQSGSCFGRIDCPCVIAWVAIQHVGGFSKERASFAARASLHSG